MNLNEYQQFCQTTWGTFHDDSLKAASAHAALGIAGEAGEAIELVKKADRGDNGGEIDRAKLTKELGDVLYYVVTLARLHGIPAQDVMETNVSKLKDRLARNVLRGSGDDR
jgi:NTP pyrophosphatase (non-canonical NTP hydrolase)